MKYLSIQCGIPARMKQKIWLHSVGHIFALIYCYSDTSYFVVSPFDFKNFRLHGPPGSVTTIHAPNARRGDGLEDF